MKLTRRYINGQTINNYKCLMLSGYDRAPLAISIFNVRLINSDTTHVRRENSSHCAATVCAALPCRKERHFFFTTTPYIICIYAVYAHMRFTYYRVSLNMRLNNNLTTTKNKITKKCIHSIYL